MPAKILDIRKLDVNMNWQGKVLDGIKWLEPKKNPFVVSGFGWFKKEKLYRRLPVKPKWKIREAVDVLADCTAGGQLCFRTDSKRVAIRVLLSEAEAMYHMPATGRCGFDCYIGAPGQKRYIGTARFDQTKLGYEHCFFETDKNEIKNITLNFPLYQGVKDLLIGIDKGSKVLPPVPYKNKKKVIIYGTSITHGGCASRPGMAYTNVLSRRFNLEFINLGFSGNGTGEPEIAKIISEIEDPACIVLDYEANAAKAIFTTLYSFINIIRNRYKNVPILVVSRIRFAQETIGKETEMRIERRDFQRTAVVKLKAGGDKNIYFLDGSTLLGKDYDECTVDGVHPTDLGFMRMADGIGPVLRKILKQ